MNDHQSGGSPRGIPPGTGAAVVARLTRLREENPDASLSDLLTFALREFDGEAADLRVAMADVRFIQQHIQRTGRPVGLPPGLV